MKKGFTLIAAIFIILVVTVFAVVVASFFSSESVLAVKNYDSLRAFYIAESGLRFALISAFKGDPDWGDFNSISGDFAGGTFTVQNLSPEANSALLQVSGVYPKGGMGAVTRVFQQGIERCFSLPEAFNYALYWQNSSGTSARLDIGGAGNDRDIVGDVFGDGNFRVQAGSSVTNGKIYVSSGYDVDGGGTYSWEATDEFPGFPAIDNSYYNSLISDYDSLIPPAPVGPYPYSNQDVTFVLTGETISFESITVSLFGGGLTIYGSGEIVSRGDFIVNGSLLVQPDTGETIALIAQDELNISSRFTHTAFLYPGTHLYSKNDECKFAKIFGFLGSVEASGVLLMSSTKVTLNWFGTGIGESSIIYIPPNAVGIQGWLDPAPLVVGVNFSNPDIFRGSIICDCTDSTRWVSFYNGQMQGIIYSPVSPVRLFGSGVHIYGAVVADHIRGESSDNVLDSNITWADIFLPEIPPAGISLEGIAFSPGSWQEIY